MSSIRSKAVRSFIKRSAFVNGTVNAQNLEQKRQKFGALEKYFPLSKSVKIKPVKTADFKAEWILIPTSSPNKVMLYIHGGGFVFSGELHRGLIAKIASKARLKALAVDYSLAPESVFPKALNECFAAYKWLLKTYDHKDIVLAGDSAGGTLVLNTIQKIISDKLPVPACAIVLSPATDGTISGKSVEENKKKDVYIKVDSLQYFVDTYMASTPKDDPSASPLHGSLKGFPPILIHVDQDEIMYSDSTRLAEKAKKEGVKAELYETKGLWHVWHLQYHYVPEAKKAINNIAQFIQKYI